MGLASALTTGNTLLALHSPIIAIGALTGDIAGSFVKRRLGIDRGGQPPCWTS